ncbi:hypothetical protein [Acetobacter syzygii]|uniref:hypothetical protein n=1 Tax=Acetobacter syzygii TaxID=146476 RepID=UPI0039ED0E87
MPVGEIILVSGKATSALGSIAKSSPSVMRFVKRAYYRITKGKVRIPIFGSGGVGKSTAAKIIAGSTPDNAYNSYTESIWTEQVPLNGDIPGELFVAPGQEVRIDRHWPDLFKTLSCGRAIGLINVVSYGYHSLEINSFKESASWRDGMSIDDFRLQYTADRRDLELKLLEEVVSGLAATTSHVWMVTIINKQDLWYDIQESVLSHYKSGNYAEKLARISSRLGSKNFQHEFIPTSLAISNLTTGSGEIIAKSTSGFDVNLRNKSLEDLSRKLNLLVSK